MSPTFEMSMFGRARGARNSIGLLNITVSPMIFLNVTKQSDRLSMKKKRSPAALRWFQTMAQWQQEKRPLYKFVPAGSERSFPPPEALIRFVGNNKIHSTETSLSDIHAKDSSMDSYDARSFSTCFQEPINAKFRSLSILKQLLKSSSVITHA